MPKFIVTFSRYRLSDDTLIGMHDGVIDAQSRDLARDWADQLTNPSSQHERGERVTHSDPEEVAGWQFADQTDAEAIIGQAHVAPVK